jgi:hypothetical protein
MTAPAPRSRADSVSRGPARIDAGAEQGLADVDIAEAGDDSLVQQRRLDRRARPFSAATR